MKKLLLSLALLATPAVLTVQAAPASNPSIPYYASVEFSYLNQHIDPVTGHLITTGDGWGIGTFGRTAGPFNLDLDLSTLSFTGSRIAMAADGSSYVVDFSGQFIDPIHSIGTFDVRDGTGRFEGLQASGTFSSAQWANGLGNSSFATGVATF